MRASWSRLQVGQNQTEMQGKHFLLKSKCLWRKLTMYLQVQQYEHDDEHDRTEKNQ